MYLYLDSLLKPFYAKAKYVVTKRINLCVALIHFLYFQSHNSFDLKNFIQTFEH